MIKFVFLIIAAYLLGSVPFGLLMARARGKDIRSIGSGNIGATNVARALGKKWAYVCFLLDCSKGLIPTLIAASLVGDNPTTTLQLLWIAVGAAAILGHVFSIYLKFTGGKGVATSLGVVLGLYPYYTIPGLVTLLVWIIVVLITKYVSAASITAALAFPISLIAAIAVAGNWTFASLWPLIIVSFILSILIVVRHAENIKRLLEGSEAKILQSRKP